jgi:hypothetical protein
VVDWAPILRALPHSPRRLDNSAPAKQQDSRGRGDNNRGKRRSSKLEHRPRLQDKHYSPSSESKGATQSSSASKCSESKRSASRLDLIWVRPAAAPPPLIAQDKSGRFNSNSS